MSFTGIGGTIADARKEKNMTQGQLAEAIGVARQTVAKWESGTAVPDLENACSLAKVLGISLDELVGRDTEEDTVPFMPKGKHFYGSVKLGSFGTLRLPEEAIETFDLHTGDDLVILGNPTYGIGVCKAEHLNDALEALKKRLHQG